MAIERINPPELAEPAGYVHVAVGQGKTVFVAGQTAQSKDGTLVGEGDLAAQAEQALINVHAALGAAGATLEDVAKATIYVVDWTEDKMEQLMEGVGRAAQRLGSVPIAASTLVPVARLFEPGYLIEFDVTAVVG